MGGVIVALIFLLIFIAPIAVVVLIISAIAKKSKEEKIKFEEIIRNIYVYIILIITLVAIISGIIATFRIGLDVALPEKYVTETSYNSQEREKNENIVELFTTISIVVTSVPIFIYHNKLAKELRKNKERVEKQEA